MHKKNLCVVCEDPALWYSDNNSSKVLLWYCNHCEEVRSEQFGCAMILAEGCGCVPGGADCACGCGGTGVYA